MRSCTNLKQKRWHSRRKTPEICKRVEPAKKKVERIEKKYIRNSSFHLTAECQIWRNFAIIHGARVFFWVHILHADWECLEYEYVYPFYVATTTIPFFSICRIRDGAKGSSFINFIKIALTRFYHLEVIYVMYPHNPHSLHAENEKYKLENHWFQNRYIKVSLKKIREPKIGSICCNTTFLTFLGIFRQFSPHLKAYQIPALLESLFPKKTRRKK